MKLISVLLVFILIPLCPLSASITNGVYLGPETYHLRRNREGGSHQEGQLNGLRVGFDYIRKHSWYFGLDYLYATGEVKGRSRRGSRLQSELTDQNVEVRVGYRLRQAENGQPYIIPFGGYGYLREVNDFRLPSPLPFKFTDTIEYVAIGFLSGVNFTPLISIGINFKVRFMLNGKSRITEDPFREDATLMIENEIQYRLDLPIKITPCHTLFGIDFSCIPFYEFRHFGGREDFPFDFMDTKFYLYGVQGAVAYRF